MYIGIIMNNRYLTMFFVLLFFYNSTSTNAYSLGIQHYHQDNVRLANDIDSVTLYCAFFPVYVHFELSMSNDNIRLKFLETDSCVIFINSIDRNKLVSYVNDFFILKSERIYYKTSHEAQEKYIITDYPFMSVRGYKKGKIVLFKKLDIATNLWREYGDTIVMYNQRITYHYNRKFIDFFELLITLSSDVSIEKLFLHEAK